MTLGVRNYSEDRELKTVLKTLVFPHPKKQKLGEKTQFQRA